MHFRVQLANMILDFDAFELWFSDDAFELSVQIVWLFTAILFAVDAVLITKLWPDTYVPQLVEEKDMGFSKHGVVCKWTVLG